LWASAAGTRMAVDRRCAALVRMNIACSRQACFFTASGVPAGLGRET